MAYLSSLYDTRDTGYPLFYSGVLTFAITACLPLNLGISKLPAFVAFAIFAAGFVSLFMLARNPQVGLDLLTHIHIGSKRQVSINAPPTVKQNVKQTVKYRTAPSQKLLETPPQDPFPYLQNMIESIVRKEEYEQMDPETKERLVQILQRLQNVSKEISKN
jgi:hypothetical protein